MSGGKYLSKILCMHLLISHCDGLGICGAVTVQQDVLQSVTVPICWCM